MTTATKTMPEIKGKPIQICASSAFNEMYGGMEAAYYSKLAIALLNNHPVDMLVFEKVHVKKGAGFVQNADGENQIFMQIRSAGYSLTGEVLASDFDGLVYPDEKTILNRGESLNFKAFWFKVDDYGEKYVGTFLFPEDY